MVEMVELCQRVLYNMNSFKIDISKGEKKMRKKLMTGICALATVLVLGACGDGKSPAEDSGKENPVVTEQPSAGQEDTESKEDSTDKKDEVPTQEATPEVTPEVMPEVTPEVAEPGTGEETPLTAIVGETVVFGTYEQDGDTTNGAEAVEWIVLDVTDGKALLLSQYGLEAMPYNETEEAMTWDACSLRAWLNTEFFETTFSAEEKERIEWTTVLNNSDDNSGVDGGKDTEDFVFLLSVDEAKKYFAEDVVVEDGRNYNTERAAKPTAYASTKPLTIVTNGSWYDGSSPYWLRTPGVVNYFAAIVDYNGEIYAFGHGVSEPKNMVRPAIWVELGQ